jgi:magnesium-transporting ATPase (P-type)
MMVQGVYVGLQRVSYADANGHVSVSRFEMLSLLRTAVLCNEAQTAGDGNGHSRFAGSATESALLSVATEHGVDVDAVRAQPAFEVGGLPLDDLGLGVQVQVQIAEHVGVTRQSVHQWSR